MPRQTTLNGDYTSDHDGASWEPKRAAGNMADVLHDVVTIVELQWRLLIANGRSTMKRALGSAAMAAVGFAILLGCAPVAMLVESALLVERFGWKPSSALATSLATGLLASIVVIGAAWARLRSTLSQLEPSRDELAQNVKWIKHVLRRRGGAHSGPPRSETHTNQGAPP
jgi:hypothetical protein